MALFFRDGCCRVGESSAARRERVDSQLEKKDSSNAAEDGDGRDNQVDDAAASALKLVFHHSCLRRVGGYGHRKRTRCRRAPLRMACLGDADGLERYYRGALDGDVCVCKEGRALSVLKRRRGERRMEAIAIGSVLRRRGKLAEVEGAVPGT